MEERLGVTLTVPPGTDPMPVYSDDGGVPVFATDTPYLLSDGVSLQDPVPVVDAGGPFWHDAVGNRRSALPVSGLWTPASLDPVFWSGGFDPARGGLFQDAAGTVPVTAAGQPVGRVTDRGGAGHHLVQASEASRPTLGFEDGRWFLSFDGTNDWMWISSVAWLTDEVTVVAGLRKLSDAARAMLVELGPATPSWQLNTPPAGWTGYQFGSQGTGGVYAPASTNGFPAPATSVVSGVGKIATDVSLLRVNGTQVASSVLDQGSGVMPTMPLYVGRRSGTSFPFSGRIYDLFFVNRVLSGGDLSAVESWVNDLTGAY